ncbi:MAG: TIGR01212 family radical SAM protein, partial [Desulfobacterales bacterium]|nr:TIGR01212 family radical SAM protein [Desulfobacterales bacterium]
TISRDGCIFCDKRGSGTGALIDQGLSIDAQIIRAKKYIKKRYGANKYIVYFQSFTNTNAPTPKLKALYDQALAHSNIVGLSIGTRPDSVNRDVLQLISSYGQNHLVWIEYGLQSSHDSTLKRINRGHNAAGFERGVYLADEFGLNICAHVILGLPGEDRKMMLRTAGYISRLPIHGIKIHLLYVIKGTPLAALYEKGEIQCLEQEEYVNLVVDFLEIIPPDMVVQRLTGDPVKSELVAPSWAKEKSENLKHIQAELKRRDTWQGRLFRKSTAGT